MPAIPQQWADADALEREAQLTTVTEGAGFVGEEMNLGTPSMAFHGKSK